MSVGLMGPVARVERAMRAHPEAIAVTSPDGQVSYEQLWLRALALAQRLTDEGVRRGEPVALCLPRSIELVVGALGILAAGGCYVAMDPDYPDERLRFVMADSGARVVVAHADTAARIGATHLVKPMQSAASGLPAPALVAADDPAYIVYTSGSTGRPKGVVIEHASLDNLVDWHENAFQINEFDRTALIASPGFDAAVWEIWPCLAAGASLHVPPVEVKTDPTALRDWLLSERITTTFVPTPLCEAIIALDWPGTAPLRFMLTGGDLLHRRPRAGLPFQVVNNYGVSEATVVSTSGTVAPAGAAGGHDDLPTLGSAIAGVTLTVVGPDGRPVPPDTAGELVIGGVSVGRRYIGHPDLNRAKFSVDAAGGRRYRTGDLVRVRADGQLVYLGRLDEQVQIRGLRIELGEIVAVLDQHPTVSASAVMAVGNNGHRRLCAYVVGAAGRQAATADLPDYLSKRLPAYMVPSTFVDLDALPLTASGKVDKAALPAPSPQTGGQPPGDGMEKRVADLWAKLLGAPVTDVNTDFFHLGGHSLMAHHLITEVQQRFGVQLSLATFLDSGRTVAGLAELLSAQSPDTTGAATTVAPLHFVFPDEPTAMSLRHFTAQWGTAQPVHALVPELPGGRFDRSVTIEQHARMALSTIRTLQPEGPLALAGHSIGGLIAYEIARQAIDSGQQVEWLGVLDTEAPSLAQLLQKQATLRWRLRRLRQQPAREQWARLAEVATRVLRHGRGAFWSANEFDYPGATAIACSYQQPGHGVPLHLFVSEASASFMKADLLGWDEVHHGELTAHRLQTGHRALLDVPGVGRLAQLMLESLNKVRG
jgi:amino acid adenylation domain-containing protein